MHVQSSFISNETNSFSWKMHSTCTTNMYFEWENLTGLHESELVQLVTLPGVAEEGSFILLKRGRAPFCCLMAAFKLPGSLSIVTLSKSPSSCRATKVKTNNSFSSWCFTFDCVCALYCSLLVIHVFVGPTFLYFWLAQVLSLKLWTDKTGWSIMLKVFWGKQISRRLSGSWNTYTVHIHCNIECNL